MPGKDGTQLEVEIRKDVVKAVNTRGDLTLWDSQVGTLRGVGRGGRLRPIKFGITGQSDTIGIVNGGRFIGVEIKREPPHWEKPSDEQMAFGNALIDRGGLWGVASSVGSALELVDGLISGRIRFSDAEAAVAWILAYHAAHRPPPKPRAERKRRRQPDAQAEPQAEPQPDGQADRQPEPQADVQVD